MLAQKQSQVRVLAQKMASYHCQKEGMLERRSLARVCLHFVPCKQPNVRLKMNRPCLILFGHHGHVESLCFNFVYANEMKCANLYSQVSSHFAELENKLKYYLYPLYLRKQDSNICSLLHRYRQKIQCCFLMTIKIICLSNYKLWRNAVFPVSPDFHCAVAAQKLLFLRCFFY